METLLNITETLDEFQSKNTPNIISNFSQQFKCGKFLDCANGKFSKRTLFARGFAILKTMNFDT